MDTLQAFMRNKAAAERGDRPRVFDWVTAARRIQESRPRQAGAGLRDDWEWTGGAIYRDGEPVPREKTYTYLASSWAIPELEMDDDVIECWRWMDETTWDQHTYWPDEALAELRTGKDEPQP